LETWLNGFGLWAPPAFVLIYALAAVLFIPGSVLTLAGGGLFGPLWGTVWNLAGASLGAGLAFLTARYVASDWVTQKAGGRLARMIEGVEAEGWRFVAFVRLVPLFPFNLLNYALGLTRIRFLTYLLTSAVCMLPGAIAYTYLGYAGREATAGRAGAIQEALLALGMLAAVALLRRLTRSFKAKPHFVDARTLKERLERDAETVLVDVRGPDEFYGPLGHIGGARNIPVANLTASRYSFSELKSASLVTICKTDKRSAKAAQVLKKAGFEHVQVLRGGMEGWNREGFVVARKTRPDA
jgi:uncharacterized membrane protein YdjX (TVP38/TMEM64 family)/rhodanese-related sulfurtransferase